MIGRHKYGHLKGLKTLTDEQKKQVEKYEKRMGIGVISKIKEPKKVEFIDGLDLNVTNLYNLFQIEYKEITGIYYCINDDDSAVNLRTILLYFCEDKRFFKTSILLKKHNGLELEPCFSKGLLIVGNSGNGKTTVMNAIRNAINKATIKARNDHWKSYPKWNEKRFTFISAPAVVEEYDSLEGITEKADFYKKYNTFRYCFDDLFRERVGNNFGRVDLFTDILFRRYENKAVTHANMNFLNSNSMDDALKEFGRRHGSHIYDRVFAMFNVIEFKGKSKRR